MRALEANCEVPIGRASLKQRKPELKKEFMQEVSVSHSCQSGCHFILPTSCSVNKAEKTLYCPQYVVGVVCAVVPLLHLNNETRSCKMAQRVCQYFLQML